MALASLRNLYTPNIKVLEREGSWGGWALAREAPGDAQEPHAECGLQCLPVAVVLPGQP